MDVHLIVVDGVRPLATSQGSGGGDHASVTTIRRYLFYIFKTSGGEERGVSQRSHGLVTAEPGEIVLRQHRGLEGR